jgi:hypothetical protein
MLGSSWVAAQLVAPQEGLSPVSKYKIEEYGINLSLSKILEEGFLLSPWDATDGSGDDIIRGFKFPLPAELYSSLRLGMCLCVSLSHSLIHRRVL